MSKIKDIKKVKKFSSVLELIIGDCGSGKSTYAVAQASKYLQKGYPVYSNIYMCGARELVIEDLLNYDLEEGAVIIFDEAATYGLAARGQSYKDSNKPNVIEFFTMYRHYKVEKIFVISPSFQDVIPIVRSRIDIITVCKKSIFNSFKLGKTRRITKKIDIVENGGSEPKEIYKWKPLSTRFHSRKLAYKLFDTYSCKTLPSKKWNVFGTKDDIEKHFLPSKQPSL